jgi:hypothetical protein
MPNHTFDLLFSWEPKDELAPLDADAEIFLKPDIHFHARNDKIAITNKCATLLEVEVDRLRRELDSVLEKGRRKFAERDRLRKPA